MRALRPLVLALALALALPHAHADRGNYLRCVAFGVPRGTRVPSTFPVGRSPPPDSRRPAEGRFETSAGTLDAHESVRRRARRDAVARARDLGRGGNARACRPVVSSPDPLLTTRGTVSDIRYVRNDYYGALNATRAANATEIAQKYRRLALRYHPDKLIHLPKHERDRARATFEAIAEAKEVLSDADARAAYDETIARLPRFARPRFGSRSVFDKARPKIGPLAVLVGCFLTAVSFITLNQRANQVSDRASIVRSEVYQRWLKRARKAAKERRRDATANGSSEEEKEAERAYFERFLEEERIVFRDGWEHTLLGRWARKLRGVGDPPKTRAEVAAAVDARRADADAADAAKASPSSARRREGAKERRRAACVGKRGKKDR